MTVAPLTVRLVKADESSAAVQNAACFNLGALPVRNDKVEDFQVPFAEKLSVKRRRTKRRFMEAPDQALQPSQAARKFVESVA